VLGATSSNVVFAGMVATGPCSGITRYSACAPNRPSLNPNTRSPMSKEATPPPIASMTPANSVPRTVGGLARPLKNRTTNGLPARKPQSVRFTVVAWTRTSTSWSPAVGVSMSAIRITSGGPYLV